MQRFAFLPASIPGPMIVERQRLEDERGFLSRFFCAEAFESAGFDAPIAQINQTLTRRRGAVRGLHFQRAPHAEIKLVTCVRGSIFDVAVDLRPGSPSLLRWHGETLSAANGRSLLIPRGFAHGFQALDEDCELIYLHSHVYAPSAEGGLNVLDPALAITWPLAITDISARDRGHQSVGPDFTGIPS